MTDRTPTPNPDPSTTRKPDGAVQGGHRDLKSPSTGVRTPTVSPGGAISEGDSAGGPASQPRQGGMLGQG